MSKTSERWGDDVARFLSNFDAKCKEMEKTEKLRKELEMRKSNNYEQIKKKYRDKLSSAFLIIAAELRSANFDNDLEVMSQIVSEYLGEWCVLIDKSRKE